MTLKLLSKLLIILVTNLTCFQVSANEAFQKIFEERATRYADAVGSVSMIDKVIEKINTKCHAQISLPNKAISETDYLLRRKASYKYSEFVSVFENPVEVEKLAVTAANQILKNILNCSEEELEQWNTVVVKPLIEKSIYTLRTEDPLYGLPKISRDHDEVIKIFNEKVKHYQNLPNEEVEELASALESGSYSYAMLTLVQGLDKDLNKSLELRKYLVKEVGDPKALYQLGETQEKSDKSAALLSFKRSAKLGYKYAEIWLGIYYACQNNKKDALFWLTKAESKDPEYINYILLEIEELGMPTNCYEGWVY